MGQLYTVPILETDHLDSVVNGGLSPEEDV